MGLKDRLATRQRPSAPYQLRIDDDAVARAELAAARDAGDESRIVAAQEAVESCYEQVRITALPPSEMEALLAAHPAPESAKVQKIFNPATFVPALLAACVESDVTEEDWSVYVTTGAMTIGEVGALFDAVWNLNYRAPDPSIPKD